jgi:hypothetical protein
MPKCPGQDQRFWKPEDIFEIKCPSCGNSIEFWKDEPSLKCPNCKQSVANPKIDLGCAKWCKHAKECIGVSSMNESNILCDRLLHEAELVVGKNHQNIDSAKEALKYAGQIQINEGGDALVVKAAVTLNVISKNKANDDISGAVKNILLKQGVSNELIERICEIIINLQNSEELDSIEYRIVYDALKLVKIAAGEKIKHLLKTASGKQIAQEMTG